MAKSQSPLVSVCIPVYNGASFICRTIESVLGQSYTNIELIILDNASIDQTPEIVSAYKDERIRYIRNSENIGLQRNWNKALAEAKGDYIKLLPADDLIYSDCVEKQVEAYLSKTLENIVLVCCGRDIIDSNGKVIFTRTFYEANGTVKGNVSVKKIVRSGTNRLGEPGAILFRKDLLAKAGSFSDEFPYVIDLGLWIKMLSYGNLFVIRDSLCAFRVSPQSESDNTRHLHSHDFSCFINSLDKRLYDLTSVDILFGDVNSFVLEILRRLFYRLSKMISLINGKNKKL